MANTPSDGRAAVVEPPFSKAELAQWREVLVARRNSLVGDISALEREAISEDRISVSSNHLAEGGSDAQDQDFSALATEGELEMVWQVDRAIRKIDTGRPLPFGVCEHTRRPIAAERLNLLPWTPLSTEAAEHLEANHLVLEDLLIED